MYVPGWGAWKAISAEPPGRTGGPTATPSIAIPCSSGASFVRVIVTHSPSRAHSAGPGMLIAPPSSAKPRAYSVLPSTVEMEPSRARSEYERGIGPPPTRRAPSARNDSSVRRPEAGTATAPEPPAHAFRNARRSILLITILLVAVLGLAAAPPPHRGAGSAARNARGGPASWECRTYCMGFGGPRAMVTGGRGRAGCERLGRRPRLRAPCGRGYPIQRSSEESDAVKGPSRDSGDVAPPETRDRIGAPGSSDPYRLALKPRPPGLARG